MIFGIDLGTTNSLIGHGDNMFTGLVSSSVDVQKKEQVERDAISPDVVSSYKVDMTTGKTGELAIQCSSIILKELENLASRRSGENCKDVVISVPAYFSVPQREAVYKAAKLAGLSIKTLINEPTAAALYVCRDLRDLVVVYDLGGGTFDITIVDSRMGNYVCLATDGRVLGGDDLDAAIVEDVIKTCKIPLMQRTAVNKKKMRALARQAKEAIQVQHSDVHIGTQEFGGQADYVLTVERYKELLDEVFGITISMTSALISKYIPASETPKIVFVGGSAACPYLRKKCLERLGVEEIQYDIKPDFVVARGVALYAELLEQGKAKSLIDDVTKQLCIEDSDGRSQIIIEENSITPTVGTLTVANAVRSDTLTLNLYQGRSFVAAQNEYIGTMEFKYGEVKDANTGFVEVTVAVTGDGIISLSAFDVLEGEESRQEIKLQMK